jgi:hypothetical protein
MTRAGAPLTRGARGSPAGLHKGLEHRQGAVGPGAGAVGVEASGVYSRRRACDARQPAHRWKRLASRSVRRVCWGTRRQEQVMEVISRPEPQPPSRWPTTSACEIHRDLTRRRRSAAETREASKCHGTASSGAGGHSPPQAVHLRSRSARPMPAGTEGRGTLNRQASPLPTRVTSRTPMSLSRVQVS